MEYAAIDLDGELICLAPTQLKLAKAMGVKPALIERRLKSRITKYSNVSNQIGKFNVVKMVRPEIMVFKVGSLGERLEDA